MSKECISPENLEYLKLLSEKFPTMQDVATEIINLNAILNLPKSTEHFLSDIHGEYEAFNHIMMNASGNIRAKIEILFEKKMTREQRRELATLVYYPKEKMQEQTSDMSEEEKREWYRVMLNYLIEICHLVTSKYTRSKVRKSLPKEYAYVIDELINTDYTIHDRIEYYDNIIQTIIDIGKAPDFICAVCDVIKRLIVDRLHIVGDIFDRGPRADIVMESVMLHHAVDIQWGNHDIVWMGAASSSRVCIATVLANSIRYNNLDVIEQGYGISLRPLAVFANEQYADSDTSGFITTIDYDGNETIRVKDVENAGRMAKAIAVILFKLEGQIIKNYPEFNMDDRLLLDKVNWEKGTVVIGGKEHTLTDTDFPTIDRKNPYALSEEEEYLMEQFSVSFKESEKLRAHIRFLFDNGSIYKCCNGNLLLHGSVPMDENGDFRKFVFDGKEYSGKEFLDYCDARARMGFFGETHEKRKYGRDFMWWLWSGRYSPLFAREKMTTFERRLIDDKSTWKEPKDPYYNFTATADGCEKVLKEFGLGGKRSHIINGHIPVKAKEGESPIKGDGKLIVIDGGFCKAYQKTTGIAGYTLIYNSYKMMLVSHEAFCGKENAIKSNMDIHSNQIVFERDDSRIKIAETDKGKTLKGQIDNLKLLMQAYKNGLIAENSKKKNI